MRLIVHKKIIEGRERVWSPGIELEEEKIEEIAFVCRAATRTVRQD